MFYWGSLVYALFPVLSIVVGFVRSGLTLLLIPLKYVAFSMRHIKL